MTRRGELSTPPIPQPGEHQLRLSWRALLPGMVEQLADAFDGGRDDKYSQVTSCLLPTI